MRTRPDLGPPTDALPPRRGGISALAMVLILSLALVPSTRSMAFEFKDGDRVVLLGGTFIEREQAEGYIETLLTARNPALKLTFRNLGWSGDTVFGPSRARFGPVAEGFQHLKDHVEALKPTVLLVSYGANEAFEGPEGLAKFRNGLGTLLDVLAKTGARIVLIGPTPAETMGPPLPDPSRHNADLGLYSEALREAAQSRGYSFLDLLHAPAFATPGGSHLTDNGIHLTPFGYWKVAQTVADELLGQPAPTRPWSVEIDRAGQVARKEGATVDKVEAGDASLRFELAAATLPLPPAPAPGASKKAGQPLEVVSALDGRPKGACELRLRGLPAGSYTLKLDGRELVKVQGPDPVVYLRPADDMARVEALRGAIKAKNLLYFHRWRPQNETYLFGFRKHEQGQNAREIPLFDPLVEEQERRIDELKVPPRHAFELVRLAETGR